jgi:hypothetical protein
LRRSNHIALTLLIVALAALALAPTAFATITSSQISSPMSPTFALFDENAPNTIAVSGTTNSDNPGVDRVNIDCIAGPEVRVLALSVPLQPDGSFSVPAGNLDNIDFQLCHLRAVPGGAVPPAELAPFAGPVVGIGHKRTETIESGLNTGKVYDYFLDAQQLAAADSGYSLSQCGVTGALYNSNLERTTDTFDCNDWFWSYENYEDPAASTRSQMQVDGANAYAPAVAFDEVNAEAVGLPSLSYTYSQDPSSGNLTIKEIDPLVKCPDPAFPPTTSSCSSFVSTGVRVERTIEETEGGRLITIADRYASTDNQAHSVDLLPQNEQQFGYQIEDAEAIGYRFPGESSFHVHYLGESVSFTGSGGTAFLKIEGSEDGDQSTGRGAIVFDRPASPATFNFVDSGDSGFYFHQTGTVPAGGSTSFRFAYVHGYTDAEVEALAAQASTAFGLTPPPPPTPTASSTPTPAPTPARVVPGTVELTKVKLNKRKGTATVLAQVSGPGTLVLTGKGIVKAKGTSHGVGVVKLVVTTKGKAKKQLAKKGKVKVKAKVAFTPGGGGATVSTTKFVVLKKQLRDRQ